MATAKNIVNAAAFVTHAVQSVAAVSAAYVKVSRLRLPVSIFALIRVRGTIRHTVQHIGASVKIRACYTVHGVLSFSVG